MRDIFFIIISVMSVMNSAMSTDSKRDSRLKARGVIGQKKISLPAEMISEFMIASNNTNLAFGDMLEALQYPIDYRSKDHTSSQRTGSSI